MSKTETKSEMSKPESKRTNSSKKTAKYTVVAQPVASTEKRTHIHTGPLTAVSTGTDDFNSDWSVPNKHGKKARRELKRQQKLENPELFENETVSEPVNEDYVIDSPIADKHDHA